MKATYFLKDAYFCLPEIFLIFCICAFTVFGLIYEKSKYHIKLASILANLASLTLLLLVLYLIICIKCLKPIDKEKVMQSFLLSRSLEFSRLSYFNKIFCTLVTIACLLSSKVYFEFKQFYYFEVVILNLTILLGSYILVSAQDLILIYVGIEIISLSLYVLISLKKNETQAVEAALKYFLLGSIASAFIVFGSAMLYSTLGMTNIAKMSELVFYLQGVSKVKFNIACCFLLVGFFYKLGIFPFHYWIGDVYTGSPTPAVITMSTIAKYPLVIVLIKINFFLLIDSGSFFKWLQIYAALMSILVGSFYAFGQKKVKRLMAYSSMVHSGFVLLNVPFNMNLGIRTAMTYNIIYILMTLAFFNFLMSVCIGSERRMLLSLDDYKGMSKQRPFIAFLLGALVFSYIGIPPFLGFFSKYYALSTIFIPLTNDIILVLLLFTLVSSVYYFRFLKNIFFHSTVKKISTPYFLWENNKSGFILFNFLVFLLFFGFFFLKYLDQNLEVLVHQFFMLDHKPQIRLR